jgi:hypothetical protein
MDWISKAVSSSRLDNVRSFFFFLIFRTRFRTGCVLPSLLSLRLLVDSPLTRFRRCGCSLRIFRRSCSFSTLTFPALESTPGKVLDPFLCFRTFFLILRGFFELLGDDESLTSVLRVFEGLECFLSNVVGSTTFLPPLPPRRPNHAPPRGGNCDACEENIDNNKKSSKHNDRIMVDTTVR